MLDFLRDDMPPGDALDQTAPVRSKEVVDGPNRRIHRVYLIVLPLFIAGQIAIVQITVTAWWSRLAHAILF